MMQDQKISAFTTLLVTGLAVGLTATCAPRRVNSTSSWQTNYKLDRPAGAVVSALRAGKEQRLLVVLNHDAATLQLDDEASNSPSEEAIAQRVAKFNEMKQKVLATAQSKRVNSEDVYSHLPIIKISAKSLQDLIAIANDQNVYSISEDVRFKFNANENLALIRQPEAAQMGQVGAGTSVAILDTGLDYKRSAFGPCTAPATPADTCRVAFTKDFATDDRMLDDSILHGTNVAGIVASIATGAKVIGLDVFDGDGAYTSDIVNAINWVIANKNAYNIASMNMSFGSTGYNNCTTGAMAVAIQSARQAGILSAVASGNGGSTTMDYPACSPYSVSVGAVYDRDMGTLDWGCGQKDVSAPDKVTCFTSSSPDIKMLAPGAKIIAAGVTMTGTSQATPHVAAAIAVVKAARPSDTVDQIQERLTSTGKPVPLHLYPNVKIPRLDLAAALGPNCQFVLPADVKTIDPSYEVSFTTGTNCKWSVASDSSWIKISSTASGQGSGKFTMSFDKPLSSERSGTVTMSGDAASVTLKVTQPPDTEAPTGTFVITGNLGNQYTTSRQVTLALDVKDINTPDKMCISNTPTCDQFVVFDKNPSWTLTDGDGQKTVYVFLKDSLGNTTKSDQPLTAKIVYDNSSPTDGSVSATASQQTQQSVNLSWSGFTDNVAPIKNYVVVYSTAQLPTNCSNGTQIYNNSGTSMTHNSLSPGTYYYRVCAQNAVGLTSAGATASFVVIEADTTPPSGTVVINGNATYTNKTAVNLTIQASDRNGVAKMCVSTSSSCYGWEAFSSTKALTLSGWQGTKTVSVWFEDNLGNRSASPVADTIIFDSVAPQVGRLSAQIMQNSAKLSWVAGSDSNGISGYKLVYKAGAGSPRVYCTEGSSVPVTPGFLVATATNLASKSYYAFRICPIDKAGNIGVGNSTVIKIP